MTKIGFAVGYYDSVTGAQRSMMVLAANANIDKSTILLPSHGALSEYAKSENIHCEVIPYADRLDKFDKELLDSSSTEKLLYGSDLMRYHTRLIRHLMKEEYDIIYCNDTRSVILFALPAKLLGIPIISYVGNDSPLGIFDRYRIRIADKIMCNTDGVRSRFEPNDVERYRHKFQTINTGVDLQNFNPEHGYAENDSEVLQITQVATIQERKGQKILLEAISNIDGDIAPYNVNFAGNTPPGSESYNQELRYLAEKYEIDDNVTFMGWVEDIHELLNKSDIFILPSQNEGLPRSLLEAAAMKLPLIATPAGGATDIVKDGSTGYIVEFEDPDDLAAKIRILAENEQLRSEFGTKAQELVQNQFSREIYVQRFEEFVSEIDDS